MGIPSRISPVLATLAIVASCGGRAAAPSAAPTETPFVVRLVVRCVVDGSPGAVLTTREIPLMVIGEP